MATLPVRAGQVLDALLNRTTTAAQKNEVLAAFGTASEWMAELRGLTLDRIKLTQTQAQKQTVDATVSTDINTRYAETP